MATERNYSKRELDTAFANLKEHLTKQDDSLNRIEKKLDYTNGKVKFHEFIINTGKYVLATGTAVGIAYLSLLSYLKK